MADNILVTPGTGATISADEIAGALHQRVKITVGADGVNDGDVSSANPLPVVQTGTPALPTGSATSAKQDTGNTSIGNVDTKIGEVQATPTSNTLLARLKDLLTGQSDKSQITQVCDGSGNVIGATSNALDINIKSGNPTTIAATQSTAANLKVEATLAAAQTLTTLTSITNDVGIKDNGNSITVDNGGTFATQPAGSIADDTTSTANPILGGGVAVETDGTDPTSVSAEGDLAQFRADRNRRQLVSTVHPNLWEAHYNAVSAQTNREIKAAPGASLSLYVTDIIVSNDGSVAGNIIINEDTAGTPVAKFPTLYIPAAAVIWSKKLATPIRVSNNKNIGFTSVTMTNHSVGFLGYTAP